MRIAPQIRIEPRGEGNVDLGLGCLSGEFDSLRAPTEVKTSAAGRYAAKNGSRNRTVQIRRSRASSTSLSNDIASSASAIIATVVSFHQTMTLLMRANHPDAEDVDHGVQAPVRHYRDGDARESRTGVPDLSPGRAGM